MQRTEVQKSGERRDLHEKDRRAYGGQDGNDRALGSQPGKSCRHRSAGDDKRDQGHASGMFDVVASAEAARVPHDNHRDDEGANRSDKCPFLPAEEADLAVSLDRVELVRGWKLLKNQERGRVDNELEPNHVHRQIE